MWDPCVWTVFNGYQALESSQRHQLTHLSKMREEDSIKVNFISEEGADFGGLTTELFDLYFFELDGKIVQGLDDQNSRSMPEKFEGLQKYRNFGFAISLALKHDLAGPGFLSQSTMEAIIGREVSNPTVDELPQSILLAGEEGNSRSQ